MTHSFDSLHSIIKQRRSGRAFLDKPVDVESLNLVLEAARWAPSCGNHQPWRFVAATQPQSLNALRPALASGNAWAKTAPVLIAVITQESFDKTTPDGRKFYQFDTGLAVENLLLQAVAQGLMCHPMAGFDLQTAKSALRVPDRFEILCLIALGWPGDVDQLEDETQRARETAPRRRKPLVDIASFEHWSPALENPERE